MDAGGAYGAGKATGQFDPIAYIKKPQVILRAVSWVSVVLRTKIVLHFELSTFVLCKKYAINMHCFAFLATVQ